MKPHKPQLWTRQASRLVPERVLMTADSVGGVWTYALELAAALDCWNIDVCLAVMGRRLTPDQAAAAAALSNVEVCESNCKLEWMENPWADVKAAGDWLLDLEAEYNPDIIHLNGYAHGSLPFDAPKLVVAHSCVCSWWRAVKGEPAPEAWNAYRAHVANGLRGADLVVAPSESMLRAVEENYGSVQASCVIPNGRTAPKKSALAKTNLILGAGRLWDEAKNVHALLQVARHLAWPVCIAGETPSNTTERVPNLTWLGRLPSADLWRWYQKARIFVSPARYEPFGLCLLEAGLCGTALVAGDIPSLREVWEDAALYVDPNDPEDLRDQLARLTSSPQLVAQFGHKARQQALKYQPQTMAAAYLDCYCALLEPDQLTLELTTA